MRKRCSFEVNPLGLFELRGILVQPRLCFLAIRLGRRALEIGLRELLLDLRELLLEIAFGVSV
jgi:hypothetical protein